MSKNDGGSAFPNTPTNAGGQCADHEWGMSLRDYFAAKAMQSLILVTKDMLKISQYDVAAESYAHADAMLAERIKDAETK